MTDQQVKNPHQSEGQNYDIWNDGHHSRDAEVARLKWTISTAVDLLKGYAPPSNDELVGILQAALKEEETNE